MTEKLRETVLNYLKEHNTMTIATSRDNVPWAATVFYANDDFTLYFLSDPAVAEHSRNIAENPQVSVTVYEDYPLTKPDDWRKVRGVQMKGTAELLTAEVEIAKATRVYVAKYPFVAPYLKL
ncbi:pyridoxamine 5'-phosphate oxidase family protein, partial [Chloroflexota bacterium]